MVVNLLLLVLWSEWCGGSAAGFNWRERVLGDYRTTKIFAFSQGNKKPTNRWASCISKRY
jgi:hypothetical protein